MNSLDHKSCWILTPPRQGNKVICRGVAKALGLTTQEFEITPRRFWAFFSPNGPLDPAYRYGAPNCPFPETLPDFIFASGRRAIPALTYLTKIANQKNTPPFTVVFQNPKISLKKADLFWAPKHDKLKGKNVISTLTSPHELTFDEIAMMRASPPPDINELTGKIIGIFLGGPNSIFSYDQKVIDRLCTQLSHLASGGYSFLITNSRRTPAALTQAVLSTLNDTPHIVNLWGQKANRYKEFLALSDHLIVTADSTNMVSEMAISGRPIHVFYPGKPKGKFKWFLNDMEREGFIRPLRYVDQPRPLDTWHYPPTNNAQLIAEHIKTMHSL